MRRNPFYDIWRKFSGLKTSIKFIIAVAIIFIISIILIIAVCVQSANSGNTEPTPEVIESSEEAKDSEESENADSEESSSSDAADEESSNSSDSNSSVVMSGVSVFFNGALVETYPKEDIMNTQPINLNEFSDDGNVLIQAVVGNNQPVKRVRVWTESENGVSNGDEYILWSDNNWTANMKLSDYSGTIIVAISVADNSTPPHNTYEYFKVHLPESEESDGSTESTGSEQTLSTQPVQPAENTAGTANPQMFINDVAVTGYQTFDESVANPVLTSAKKLTISAGNVSDDVSRISVQLGKADGTVAEFECNPLTKSNDWKQTVDVSKYDGEILVLNVTSEIGFASGSTNQFVAVKFQ